ncbi:Transglycosylase-associated protein [Alteracholeplasma palmae J233]|uniref:Transglycosylase-associated protein n=1 Tax=Alteracholeplasma palmae (strain ATCC 49389 / J233) TaxID=1318466 RepID=U4KLH1_ALTPJ|nr:GlsB/YeaQ/YmgE family stress response membrane protein [Alteracholeplasma palmae]CCV64678.1 Transglycosylase-associated protein [Alteracholeplasma palmae J233]
MEWLWNLLIFLAIGALIGYVAAILTGNKKDGLIRNIIIGILGSLVGGIIGKLIPVGDANALSLWGILLSVVGSIIVIVVGRFVTKRR